MRLAGTSVLLTGASSGIGRAAANVLAARGARLLLTGRDLDRLSEVGRTTGASTYAADLLDPAAPDRIARWATENGPPQVVVHNAGIGLARSAEETTVEDLQRILTVNVTAPITLTRLLLPGLRSHAAANLTFVTSIAGLLGVADESAYAASKAAMQVYARSLSSELAGTNVRVTTFAPGVVNTAFFDRRATAYPRRFPQPMATGHVAEALVNAIERDRPDVVLPRWLRIPVWVQTAAPTTYDRLARRWG